jgi:hypothetical protein
MEIQERVVTELQKEEGRTAGLSGRNSAVGVTSLILIVLCLFFALHRQNPPDAQSAGAPVDQFASGRAMEHLKIIADKPHHIAAASEHSDVRDYILKALANLGVTPEVQKTSVLDRRRGGPYVAASVQNIIGKMEGTDSRKAILLACHYDSAASSPGASDDGAAVAALLEVIRALKASPQLKNDMLFLFTDGEEIGSLGAKAFMDEHPRAKDVAVTLNFEARGVGGPSIMFETSEGNEWLINAFAEAAPHPVANSLTYNLYKLLGNDTDLTIFKNGGLQGLNFAYIAGHSYYHTARDSQENIDERSLQHHGSYALALARHFGNMSSWPARASNVVYFDIFSAILISYSERLVAPLMALILLLYVGLIILGFRMKRFTAGGLAFGAGGFLLNAISVGVLMIIIRWAIRSVSSDPTGGDYRIDLYAAGLVSLTVALSGALLAWFGGKTKIENLTAGALLWWVVLMIPVGLLAPGGSYLFTWPLLLMLLALGAIFILKEKMTSAKSIIILTFPALSGLILIAPMIRLALAGFGIDPVWVLMILVVFLLSLQHAHLSALIAIKKRLLPVTAAALGICLVGAGILMSGVSSKNPKTDHIFYLLNADTGKAIWGSFYPDTDEWTAQFFSSGAETAAMGDYFARREGDFLKGDAPALSLAPPDAVVLDDKKGDGFRQLRLRVSSHRRARALSIYWKRGLKLGALTVDGKRASEENFDAEEGPAGYRRFTYFGLPEEGIELSLEVRSSDPIDLKIEEWTHGLPEAPGKPRTSRPGYIIAAPILYSDSTVITKSFTF